MPISSRVVVRTTVILLAIGFLTLLAIVVATAWLSEKANSYFETSNSSRALRVVAVELRSALQSAESSQRGYLIGGNEIYLAPYDAAKSQALTNLQLLKQYIPLSPRNAAILDRISKIVAEKVAEMDRIVSLKTELDHSQAAAVFSSNRSKALMDEANLFLSSIIRQADERLEISLNDQRRNATLLRLASIIGGLVIVLVVAGAIATVFRYAWEVTHARNELNALNHTLEDRVVARTAELTEARDRAELLVAEVNHRVANSLSLVASVVRLQSNLITDPASKEALKETEARILAVASVHQRLYSSDNARFVDLHEYLSSVLDDVKVSMRGQGYVSSLRYDLEPIKLKTDSSINIGVIVTEWVTNAFKYAYPDRPGEVRVRLRRLSNTNAELYVEDDGVGRTDGPAKGTGLGTRIVNAMAHSLGGNIEYVAAGQGTVARLEFSAALES